MTDFYSQNRCVCSTRSHGPLLCAFCLSFHFKYTVPCGMCSICYTIKNRMPESSACGRNHFPYSLSR